MKAIQVGKRGTVVIPVKTRQRYKVEEGSSLLLEEREDGFFFRPAETRPVEVEIYTPERLAEFFLNNVMSHEGYLEARTDVEAMGIDPDSINHIRWPQ